MKTQRRKENIQVRIEADKPPCQGIHSETREKFFSHVLGSTSPLWQCKGHTVEMTHQEGYAVERVVTILQLYTFNFTLIEHHSNLSLNERESSLSHVHYGE